MDSGLGFNNEDVKIFSPFQMDSKTKFLNKNGSGLGLLIVKELCESFNSKIHYNSIKGKGTEFWFDIENNNNQIIDQSSFLLIL
jgi:signal transduction histidine kinase